MEGARRDLEDVGLDGGGGRAVEDERARRVGDAAHGPDGVLLLAVVEGKLGVLPYAGGAIGAEEEAVEVQRGDVAVEARLTAPWVD